MIDMTFYLFEFQIVTYIKPRADLWFGQKRDFFKERGQYHGTKPENACALEKNTETKESAEPDPSVNKEELMPVTMWRLCQSQWLDNAQHNMKERNYKERESKKRTNKHISSHIWIMWNHLQELYFKSLNANDITNLNTNTLCLSYDVRMQLRPTLLSYLGLCFQGQISVLRYTGVTFSQHVAVHTNTRSHLWSVRAGRGQS